MPWLQGDVPYGRAVTMQLKIVCPGCRREYIYETRVGASFSPCPHCEQQNPSPDPPPGFCRLCWHQWDQHSYVKGSIEDLAMCPAR